MPFRKTYRKKRSVRRTRKSYNITRKRRSTGRGGFLRVVRWSSSAAPNVHYNLTGADANPSGNFATLFALNQVNGFAELVSLFDNFRITKVLYRWIITRDPSQASTAGNRGIYPRIVWTHDFNDSAPISRDLIYQRANMKEAYFSDNIQRTKWYSLKPSILSTMYESGVANAYSPKWAQWLDTADNATPHYGIKFAYDNLYTGISMQLEAKIFMECKGIS